MDHAKFVAKSHYTTADLDLLLQDISCKTISDDSKLSIMHQAVAPCLEININIKGKSTTSLLDSRSVVTLMNESYFREHIEHRLLPSSGMYNNSHNLFNLKGVEEGHVPLTRHFECDIEVGGQTVHRVGILVKKDKVPLNDSNGRSARTPALIGSNLISLVLNEFCETHGEECIRLFECPVGISPLWFSTPCLYFFAHVAKKTGVGASAVSSDPSNDRDKEGNKPHTSQTGGSKSQKLGNTQTSQGERSQRQPKKEDKHKPRKRRIDTLGGYAGRVMVGDKRQPICIPAGMSKVVVGRTQERLPRGSYMVEATDDDNLPCGVSVNHTCVNPTESRQVSVTLLNTNTYNVWIRQPLYAATIWDVELKDWEYEPIFTKDVDSNTIEIKLQQVPPEDLREDILSRSVETEQSGSEAKQKETTHKKDKNHLSVLDLILRVLNLISKKNSSDYHSNSISVKHRLLVNNKLVL